MKRSTSITRLYFTILKFGAVSIAGLLLLIVLLPPKSGLLRVYYLDIGQGDATLIRTPDDTSILIDAGPDNTVLQRLGETLPWWEHSIDYAIITHPDLDHYGGFLGVVQKYHIGHVFYNGEKDSVYYNRLLTVIQQKHIPLDSVRAGQKLSLDSGIQLTILWPQDGYAAKSKNAFSIASMLSWRDVRYLFMADVPQDEELEILNDHPDLIAAALKVGHHGSKSSSNATFLAQVHARYCIISAGKKNRYGHPHAEVLARLKAAHCEILQTALEGTILLATDGHRLWHVR